MRPATDGCGCFPTGRHYPGIAHLLRLRVAGLTEEYGEMTPWMELPIAMIDVETTGKDPAIDRIVELAIVRGQHGAVVSRSAWLINPGRPIPADATAVHGIQDADVSDKPSFADVAREVMGSLQNAVPAAYNASFDRGFLHAELARTSVAEPLAPAHRRGVAWIDPLIWARYLQAQERSRALGDVAARLGVELDQAHRATADAEAALLVLYRFQPDARVPSTYGALIQEQTRIARAQEEARQMWRGRGG
jgi:DNA polymerase-3 subunit epsilon